MPDAFETQVSETSFSDLSITEPNEVKIFTLPFVNDNPDGWGPNNQPDKYRELPYQKFSKSDRIGKVGFF